MHNKTTTAFADTIIEGLQLTQADRQQLLQMDAREYIKNLFEWNDGRVKSFIATMAYTYCFHYTGGNAIVMRKMMDAPAFWPWFINGFHNRNIQFMQAHQNGSVNPYTPYNEYLMFYQNAQQLAKDIYPGPEVWAQINGGGK